MSLPGDLPAEDAVTSPEGRRLLALHVFFQSPWERLANRLWAVDVTGKVVRDGSLRDRLACWCDRRDTAWRKRWGARWPERPPAKWRRPSA